MCIFFFKQKTAYEMRISDWSSDVCSSDLSGGGRRAGGDEMSEGYAGDLRPAEAWALLEKEPKAVLVDVRTAPEWGFVGVPRLDGIGKEALCISWQAYPTMARNENRSEEHTSELQSLMRISYAVFCLKKKKEKSRK